MIRIEPDFTQVDLMSPDAERIFAAIVTALLQVPVFPSGVLPVVVVLPRHLLMTMERLHHPHDPDTQRTLTRLLFDSYGHVGLHSFASDGEDDDEQREADADKRLLELLASHPDAYLRDGRKRVDLQRAEIEDLRARLAHAEQLLRGDMTPEHEQALDCDHPGAWRDLALMKAAECERLCAQLSGAGTAVPELPPGYEVARMDGGWHIVSNGEYYDQRSDAVDECWCMWLATLPAEWCTFFEALREGETAT